MKKSSLIMLVGVVVVVMPFLGFPNAARVVVFVICGLVIFSEGYAIRRIEKEKNDNVKKSEVDSFVQNEAPEPEIKRI